MHTTSRNGTPSLMSLPKDGRVSCFGQTKLLPYHERQFLDTKTTFPYTKYIILGRILIFNTFQAHWYATLINQAQISPDLICLRLSTNV